MVRHGEGEESLLKYLSNISNDYKCSVGLILGQISSQKYNIIHFAKTPPSAQDPPITPKKITDIPDTWIADHAYETTRMLPGGMHVLGIFAVTDEDILNPFNSKLKSILNFTNTSITSQTYLYGSRDNCKLVLHYSPKSHKFSAKTYDVATSNVQPAELKFLEKVGRFVDLECTYQIDQIYQLEKSEPLRKHIKVILDDISKNLESALYLFDNDLRDADEKLENMNKKKKMPRGQKAQEECPKPILVSIIEKCKLSNPSDKIDKIPNGSQIRIIGEVASTLWLNAKGTFGEAIQAVKEDILRSLNTRMEMHWDSLTEEELGEDLTSVHEPPRRVLISLPGSNVTISDYLFPGEGADNAKSTLQELFDISLNEKLDMQDLEGQADVNQYYKESSVGDKDSEDFLPKLATDSNRFYLLGLAVAVFVLIVALIAHLFMN